MAFISDRTGIEQVWTMNVNGSNPKQLTTDPVTHDELPDWSPDGAKIVYADGPIGSERIFVMNSDGSDPHQLTSGPGDEFAPAWSPDGAQIAFLRDAGTGDRPIYLMNADGSDQHLLTGRGVRQFAPAWQPLAGAYGRGQVTKTRGPGSTASFAVSFSSSAPGQGEVYFGSGPGCSGLVEVATQDLHPGTTHHTVSVTGNDLPGTVGDIGILAGVTYWYEVVTVTRNGTEIDNNGGTCYSVPVPSS